MGLISEVDLAFKNNKKMYTSELILISSYIIR